MWSVVTLATSAARASAVARWARSASGVEPVTFTRPRDPRAWVELYFPEPEPAEEFRQAAARQAGIAAVGLRSGRVRVWSRAWQERFEPIQIGQQLMVIPALQGHRTRERRPTLRIEPGLGFGTGRHFTTRFCLERIAAKCSARPRPRSLLDLGTGSGILALAAARLGVRRVLGTDHDPVALAAAAENARRNRLSHRVQWIADDLERSCLTGRFDLVAANLYGAVLIRCAERLARLAGRTLIVSGVQEAEADAVGSALTAAGLEEVLRDGDGEWCGMEFVPRRRRLSARRPDK